MHRRHSIHGRNLARDRAGHGRHLQRLRRSDAPELVPLQDVVQRLLASAGQSRRHRYRAQLRRGGSRHRRAARAGCKARDDVFVATQDQAPPAATRGMRQVRKSETALRTRKLDLIQVHNLIDTATQLGLLRDLETARRDALPGHHALHGLGAGRADRAGGTRKAGFRADQSVRSPRGSAEKRLLPACQAQRRGGADQPPLSGRRACFARCGAGRCPSWASDIDCTSWAQIFLKFIVGHPAVTAVIPATSKPANMQDNLMAGFGRLPDAAHARTHRRAVRLTRIMADIPDHRPPHPAALAAGCGGC